MLLTMHEDEDLFDEAMEIGVKAYVPGESAVEDLLTAVHAVAAGEFHPSAPIAGCWSSGASRRRRCGARSPVSNCSPLERRILRLIAGGSHHQGDRRGA